MKIIKFLEKNHEQILYIALVLFVVVSFTGGILSARNANYHTQLHD